MEKETSDEKVPGMSAPHTKLGRIATEVTTDGKSVAEKERMAALEKNKGNEVQTLSFRTSS